MAKKTTRKKSSRTSAGKQTTPRRTRRIENIDTADLQAELNRRQRGLEALERKHAKLMEQVETVEAEIQALVGSAAPGTVRRSSAGRKRPRNSHYLADSLAQVLSGKKMNVTEAVEAVQAAGYKSTAANFRVIVNQCLLRDSRFKKVARGVYTAK